MDVSREKAKRECGGAYDHNFFQEAQLSHKITANHLGLRQLQEAGVARRARGRDKGRLLGRVQRTSCFPLQVRQEKGHFAGLQRQGLVLARARLELRVEDVLDNLPGKDLRPGRVWTASTNTKKT